MSKQFKDLTTKQKEEFLLEMIDFIPYFLIWIEDFEIKNYSIYNFNYFLFNKHGNKNVDDCFRYFEIDFNELCQAIKNE